MKYFLKINKIIKLAMVFFLKKKLFFHIHCIFDNLGDNVVAQTTMLIFSRYIPLEYSLKSKLHIITKKCLRNRPIINCLGGGTLIFSSLDTEWFITLKHLMDSQNKISFTFGTGVRDPSFFKDINQECIKEWVEVLNKIDYLSVRGAQSKNILEYAGLKNIDVIGDPAIYFCDDVITQKNYRKKIGINITQNHQFYNNSKRSTIETLICFIKILLLDDWEITLFPVNLEDFVLAKDIAASLSRKIKIFRHYLNITLFLAAIKQQDIFIGTKLHSVIFAFCTYTPSLMIAYQPKCYDFMITMGMNDHVLRCDKINLDNLKQKIDLLYSDIENTQQQQFESIQRLKVKQFEFTNKIILRVENK